MKMALEAEPTPLAQVIAGVLKKSPSQFETPKDALADKIAERTEPAA